MEKIVQIRLDTSKEISDLEAAAKRCGGSVRKRELSYQEQYIEGIGKARYEIVKTDHYGHTEVISGKLVQEKILANRDVRGI